MSLFIPRLYVQHSILNRLSKTEAANLDKMCIDQI